MSIDTDGSLRQAYDPEGTGFMDAEILRSIFENLGFGQMSDEDLSVLVEAADGDSDGRVSIDDFRGMCASAATGDGEQKKDADSTDTEVDSVREQANERS